ncbi:MAG: TRAP transporter small permease [Thalassovita sp.]
MSFAESLLRWVATVSLLVLFWLILINVVARSFELAGFAWFDEVVRGSFAYMVFFGAAALWLKRDHFQVDWLERVLPAGLARWALRSLVAVLSLGFLCVMTWYGWVLFNKANALTPILQIPERLFYAAIPISGAIMVVHTIAGLISETFQIMSRGESSS